MEVIKFVYLYIMYTIILCISTLTFYIRVYTVKYKFKSLLIFLMIV